MAEPKLRTSIKDVKLCNPELTAEVARLNKTTIGDVEEKISFVGKYIHDTIKRGSMEAVMLPYFGKFKPKEKKVLAFKKAQAGRLNGGDMIFAAITGRNVVDRRPKSDTDETI